MRHQRTESGVDKRGPKSNKRALKEPSGRGHRTLCNQAHQSRANLARFLLACGSMRLVLRHCRWLACSALAVGCLLNPQGDLPNSPSSTGPQGAPGSSGSSNDSGPGRGGAGPSSAGSLSVGFGGDAQTGFGGSGGAPAGVGEAGEGGSVFELPIAGAPGEGGAIGDSGAAGATTAPP
jgi:hypothetical protein